MKNAFDKDNVFDTPDEDIDEYVANKELAISKIKMRGKILRFAIFSAGLLVCRTPYRMLRYAFLFAIVYFIAWIADDGISRLTKYIKGYIEYMKQHDDE